MPVSDLVRLGVAAGMTNQQLADLALAARWNAADYRKAGRMADAAEADRESAALLDLINGRN